MTFALLVVSAVVMVGQAPTPPPVAPTRSARPTPPSAAAVAPSSEQEPGDSLYRRARQLLNRNRYTEAAARFKEFREQNARSEKVADALYFEAFALYRGGDIDQLREARARLREQEARFPRAATRSDTKTLRVRVLQELAQRGDAQAGAAERALGKRAVGFRRCGVHDRRLSCVRPVRAGRRTSVYPPPGAGGGFLRARQGAGAFFG